MSDEEVDELLKIADTSSGEVNYTGMFLLFPPPITYPTLHPTERIYRIPIQSGKKTRGEITNSPRRTRPHDPRELRYRDGWGRVREDFDSEFFVHGIGQRMDGNVNGGGLGVFKGFEKTCARSESQTRLFKKFCILTHKNLMDGLPVLFMHRFLFL